MVGKIQREGLMVILFLDTDYEMLKYKKQGIIIMTSND